MLYEAQMNFVYDKPSLIYPVKSKKIPRSATNVQHF